MKNVIITLRVYRGKLNYDASGNVTSENQTVKLRHDIQEWYNFLKCLRINGYHKVGVVRAVQMTSEGDKEITDFSKYSAEVKEAFTPTLNIAKTPEQIQIEKQGKEIAELKALITGGKPKVIEPITEDNKDVFSTPAPTAARPEAGELEVARKRLHELSGEKPHHAKKLASILVAIKEIEDK